MSDRVFRSDDRIERVTLDEARHDLYQLLAYATALDLPGGLLIYAQGEEEPAAHRVRHAGKLLEVAALNLSGTPAAALLAPIADLAQRVRAMRVQATVSARLSA